MPVKDYNTAPDLNTQISGINIAEGCAPSGINNAIRQLMADVKEEFEGEEGAVSSLESTLRALIAEEVAKCYPKSGGVLGGTIIRNGFLAQNSEDNNLMIIRGGTDATSAFLGLCGKDYAANPGLAYLFASDGTNSATFSVAPNGTARVAGNNVITSAGGTMTGNLQFTQNGDAFLYRGVTNGRFIIRGGTSGFTDGASLYLHGKDYSDNPGCCDIYAHNGTKSYRLRITPDGTTSLGTSSVITLVASWKSGKNWYRKYSDGWIEQGGTSPAGKVTLHLPFSNTNYTITHATVGWQDTYLTENSKTTTGFTISQPQVSTSPAYDVPWYACGY